MRALIEQELQQAAGIAAKPQTTAALASTGPDRLGDDLLRIAADAWRIPADKLDPLENLANFGVDSIAITELMAKISRAFALSVAPTTFFEARNLNDLARILRKRYAKPLAVYYAAQTPPSTAGALPPEQQDISAWLTRHKAVRRAPKQAGDAGAHIPIAIISMAGKFAASPDLETLEAHLHAGRDCLSEVPEDRWDWRAVFGDPRKGAFTDVKYGGFIDGHDRFDAAFFNISPREAELMDPQHRLFMECVYTLIERGGYAPSSLGEKKIGLFLGINLTDYANLANRAGLMDARQMTGLGHAFCPNRLSFLLDIHGPSEVIDTACSSSLVAVHRAVMAIRQEGCPMAIAGGANLLLTPEGRLKVTDYTVANSCR